MKRNYNEFYNKIVKVKKFNNTKKIRFNINYDEQIHQIFLYYRLQKILFRKAIRIYYFKQINQIL